MKNEKEIDEEKGDLFVEIDCIDGDNLIVDFDGHYAEVPLPNLGKITAEEIIHALEELKNAIEYVIEDFQWSE